MNNLIRDPFPYDTNGLPDDRWCQVIAGLIAADLPKLSEDDREVVYGHLIELRMWTFERVAA